MTAGPAAAAPARGRRPPLLLAATAVLVVAAVLLPLAYLLVRGLGADEEARAAVQLGPTLRLVFDTGLLVLAVTAAAIVMRPLSRGL